jgi:single-strand DNA-binding protein
VSNGFSKTIIIGNVGGAPEAKYTASGKAVTTFSVAVNKKWGDKETTTWFRVSAWEKLGEICAQYITSGKLVMVEGEVGASAWTAQSGDARASLELTARDVRFLSGGNDSSAPKVAVAPPTVEDEDIPF